jgi:hypothetical protein
LAVPVGPPADAFHNVSFDEFLSGFVVNILLVFFVKEKRFKKIAWIPSHHLHVQWKFKLLAGKFACQQTFGNKKFIDITQQCFALLPQVNFATNNLNFHWR